MSTKTDVDTEDLESDGADRPNSDVTISNEDYKRRFDGANRKIGKMQKQIEALERQLDSQGDTYETQLSELRRNNKSVADATKELTDKLRAAEQERDTFKVQVDKVNIRDTEHKVIKGKFPQLEQAFFDNDLRSRVEFTGDTADADYEAYLTRMAARINPPQTPPPDEPAVPSVDEMLRRYSGITPDRPAPTTPAGGKTTRTPEQISAEMGNLDPRDPKQKDKYEGLLKELDLSIG